LYLWNAADALAGLGGGGAQAEHCLLLRRAVNLELLLELFDKLADDV